MSRESVWYRIGYALEQARGASSPPRLRTLAERLRDGGAERPTRDRGRASGRTGGDEDGALDALLAAGSGALASRLLGLWAPVRGPGLGDLVRAGAAGAGASLLRKLASPLLHGEVRAPDLDGELGDALLAGAARGLVYAAVVEPRLPGPAVARGLAFGTAEYLASPWGGVTRLVGRSAPHQRIPFLSGLFEGYEDEDDRLLDHLAFAVALAILYRTSDD